MDPIPGVFTISMADHDNHARQRKALSHGFSKKALWSQEEIVQGYVKKLIDHFKKFSSKNQAFDVVKYMNFITFDIIGKNLMCPATPDDLRLINLKGNSAYVGQHLGQPTSQQDGGPLVCSPRQCRIYGMMQLPLDASDY